MQSDSVPTIHEHQVVPGEIRALSTITDPHYTDFFTLAATGVADHTAEEWARAAFEKTFAGPLARLIFRGLLQLRLDRRPSPDHLSGWKIGGRGDRWLRIEATSWSLAVHLVVRVADEKVSAATIVRYHNAFAARIWSPMSTWHRRGMAMLLRRAHQTLLAA
ncbi:hypothetical protein GCM10011581_11130 [Saccharopolyspora subtropica]|uniref:DUF2867 domain-containing protein n=1 Tax=Saccharopolyspora thermophila TaxID=89367 RepID=A0A917JLG0_9PSEU|nr:hypothetical protein [Saccharopolyspora subtropica]GGI75829.1 hypothetical protein GCM10011581_11130 [Saccharopolyspora subtropica]